ncbi:IWS1-like protein [Nymphaea thermarum]|nr:IWS1-like protein [Nymphaea thermarum]
MGYEDDPYRDEDGEPLMYPDMPSDGDESSEPLEEDWRKERSPTPVVDACSGEEGQTKKSRKRLIKKSNIADNPVDLEDDASALDYGDGKSRKSLPGEAADDSKLQRRKKLKDGWQQREKKSKLEMNVRKSPRSGGKGASPGEFHARGSDAEMVKEMWESIAGADSEDDQEGVRTKDDDAFIDDTGVDPADRCGSDGEAGSAGDAPQAEEGEEDDEIKQLFNIGKKKSKKTEKTAEETAMVVEQFMARLEVAAEEDAELNRQAKPAINKLKLMPMLTEVLSKRQLQQEFLDRGVLSVLKNWLEPLPNGCLPNINVRTALLNILIDLPIDVEQHDRKEQLKRSGLGKVIMFLSRSEEETTSNKRLARELVDKWSRSIFQKSTRLEDLKAYDDERVPIRKPSTKMAAGNSGGFQSGDDDFDLVGFSQEPKSGQSAPRQHVSLPEAVALDFVVRPQSKIDPEEVRARAKQVKQDNHRMKMNKKLQQLKGPRKKPMQAQRLSVEGRGMVKFF